MAQLNGNACYLDIDGTSITSDFIEVNLEPTMESVDTTAGASTEHRERNEGLKDTAITIRVGYDTTRISTILPLIEPGTHTVTYGPEGNTSGKPKHSQSFIFEGAPFAQTVDKQHVIFEVSGAGAAAPTVDMFSGGVWS